MTPDIPKVDPDRHLDLRAAAWYFSDEVLRGLFHGNSLSDLKDLLIPFIGQVRPVVPGKRGFEKLRRPRFELADNPTFEELAN